MRGATSGVSGRDSEHDAGSDRQGRSTAAEKGGSVPTESESLTTPGSSILACPRMTIADRPTTYAMVETGLASQSKGMPTTKRTV